MKSLFGTCGALAIGVAGQAAYGEIIWQNTSQDAIVQITGNALTEIGDDVTLAPGTGRLLTSVDIPFQTYSNGATPAYTPAFIELTLYNNDGPGGTPGTEIGSSTVPGPSFPAGGNSASGGILVTFPFAALTVPETFSFAVINQNALGEPDGANPDGNQFGPYIALGPGTVGTSPETALIENGGAWSRSTFGQTFIDIPATFNAVVPEPSSVLGLGAFGASALLVRRRRRSAPA